MRIAFLSLILILFSWPLNAWNSTDHQAIGRLSLQAVAPAWGLDRPVPVRPLQSLLAKLPQEIGDSWHLADWLKINPSVDFEKPVPQAVGKTSLTPWQILAFYAIDPDDGRDQGLLRRDEKGKPQFLYPDQKWFGNIDGPNSQAFRHIEKPPFSFHHPLATFGFPFRALGEASRRAQIWFDFSQLAFALGEDYWGWRFLANSFHYLQDLHNPYHAGQITPRFLASGLKAYVTWGYRKKGFIGTLAHLVANSHRFFESYVEKQALPALEGKNFAVLEISIKQLAEQIRDESNLFFPELLNSVSKATNPILLGPYEFKSDNGDKSDPPEKFLTAGPQAEAARQRIFEITRLRFASAGQVMRTVVRAALDRRGTRTAEQILQELQKNLSDGGKPE